MNSQSVSNSEKCKRYRERKRSGQVRQKLPLTNAERCKRYRDRVKNRGSGESASGGALNVSNNEPIKNNHALGKIAVTPVNVCEAYPNIDQTYPFVDCVKLEMNVHPYNTKGGMSEAVHSLSLDQVKQEYNSSVEELSLIQSRNDKEDSRSFRKEFIEGQQIEDFISPKSWKSDAVHSLFVHGVKLEDNCSAEELRFDEEDSKSFQKELIEGTREDFISPESWKSEGVHSVFIPEVKLEDNCSVEELSFQESRNDQEDSNSVLEEFISDKDMEDTDFILPVSCVLRCEEKESNEINFPEYRLGTANEETNVKYQPEGSNLDSRIGNVNPENLMGNKDTGLECHIDNIHHEGENRNCDHESNQESEFEAHHDDEGTKTAQYLTLQTGIEDEALRLKAHKCHICDYNTNQKGNLTNHINSVHLKLKNFKCYMCEYSTANKSSMNVHIEDVHLKFKQHKCEQCEFTTTHRNSLRFHIKSVHLKLKNYKCHLCSYATSQKSALTYHIDGVHLKLKDHKCPTCEYATSTKNSLKFHIDSVHLKLKNHECHLCDYTASQKAHLDSHINAVHLKLKNHKCHMCDYASSKHSHVTDHIKFVHMKVRNHKCQMCDYVAAKRCNLTAHIKNVHLKLKSHKCHMCDYMATKKIRLESHISKVHKN